MMLGYLVILTATPTSAFLSKPREERHALLQMIAARLQEWTGEGGGVNFSERITNADGSWGVVLCIAVRDEGLAEAVGAALHSNEVAENFSVGVVFGELLGYADPAEAPSVTERILASFLD